MWKCKSCDETDFNAEFENVTFDKSLNVQSNGYIIGVTCAFCQRSGDDLTDVAEWVDE
ncbi:MAG: hypothetical protein ACRDAS_13710 [Cetobacterium sp.]